jgi:hypothetical protein
MTQSQGKTTDAIPRKMKSTTKRKNNRVKTEIWGQMIEEALMTTEVEVVPSGRLRISNNLKIDRWNQRKLREDMFKPQRRRIHNMTCH